MRDGAALRELLSFSTGAEDQGAKAGQVSPQLGQDSTAYQATAGVPRRDSRPLKQLAPTFAAAKAVSQDEQLLLGMLKALRTRRGLVSTHNHPSQPLRHLQEGPGHSTTPRPDPCLFIQDLRKGSPRPTEAQESVTQGLSQQSRDPDISSVLSYLATSLTIPGSDYKTLVRRACRYELVRQAVARDPQLLTAASRDLAGLQTDSASMTYARSAEARATPHVLVSSSLAVRLEAALKCGAHPYQWLSETQLCAPTTTDPGDMSRSPPYAVGYYEDNHTLPWLAVSDDHTNVPWLPHLPPEAKGSLYNWGWHLFTQTDWCKRSNIGEAQYDVWRIQPEDTVPAMLANACAAFAYSPLSMVIDTRTAVRCIERTVTRVKGDANITTVLPSLVERELDSVCAAGCGKGLGEDAWYCGDYGKTLMYCSAECLREDVLKVPDAMRIYLCWPTKTAATYIDQHYLQATAHLQSEFAKAYEHELAALRAKDEAPPSHEELTELLAGRLHELGFPVRDADKEGRFVSNPPTATQPTTTNANTTNPPSNMVQDVSMEQVATNAPANQDSNVQAVLGKQLTKADLKRMGEKVGVHWVARPRDRHPTLWHVRRRAMERMASHMGLPAAVLEGLLWVALQRGDACGSLTALARADPAGLSLPPELREPFRAWASLSDLTGHLLFYTLSEKAVCETVCAFVRSYKLATDASRVLHTVSRVCATCGAHHGAQTPVTTCAGCMTVSFCSRQCRARHVDNGFCKQLQTDRQWKAEGRTYMPDLSATAATIDQQTTSARDLRTDVLRILATLKKKQTPVYTVDEPTTSTVRRENTQSAGEAIAAEYAQCAQTHPHLQRVAQVILPPCGERHPDSPAVRAAHEMLVCAAGLLDDKDWEEIMSVVGSYERCLIVRV